MQEWWSVEVARERNASVLAEAEERRLARLAAGGSDRGPLLARTRARVARGLFGFAVTLEREETWRAVWERLEAPKHP